MTTEVAVLNKLAIALAADSAATIGHKIYNTANKIFDISDHQPFALMIYNTAEYMGLPFELVAKEFRKAANRTTFRTVSDCADRFIKFIEAEMPVTADDEGRLATSVAYHMMTEAEEATSRDVIPKWLQSTGSPGPTTATLIKHINDHFADQINQLRQQAPSRCFGLLAVLSG